MIEAMACGTPAITWRCGAVPEVVDDGLTGFIVTSEDEAVSAVERASGPDRAEIRRSFERRFTATVMARNYLSLYWSLAYGSDPDLKVAAVARRASRARAARKVRLTGFSFDGGAPPVKLLSGSARPNAMGER